ncbi:hypothetical protein B0H17DRAFT_1048381 [Mycena rosella]|uniref:Actin cytoskeleton-regulatory complex protein SLA1 n=1 Tax=Mycena rosella TaxID=1033263 RepID=A0AAD7DV31_MYCRO|nr:hypothetical protein B0H17DRAFT_1048381 [Mycena rosella]
MAAPSEHYLAVLKASYDYDPDPGAEDEISIKENQLLFLKERVDQDWWRVKVKGESQEDDSPVGLVPAAYVEPADHTSVVKALYDYEANAPGELSITEDQVLLVFDTEEDWLLVQTDEDGGKAGFVPANYVEASSAEEEAPAPQIVVPSSPPKPAYVDPAARVASSKIKADDIKTWSVSEVDKKGKKKKGTLGVGNGAVFFASESDKTPVQKWQTIHIQSINVEKSKHVHIDVAGPNPINLHFSVGSKDNADAIVTKLESSKQMSAPSPASSPPPGDSTPPRDVTSPKKATVHFAPESPTVIPISDGEEEEEEAAEENGDAQEEEGNVVTALYDFTADGTDELSVAEGERLLIIERDGDEWWKCRNDKGQEGVVPAQYLESAPGSDPSPQEAEPAEEEEEEEEVDDGSAAREAEERAEALRLEKAKEKERADKERKKQEAQQRAKAAAVSAELERKKRKEAKEAAAAANARAEAESPPPAARAPPEPKKTETKAPPSSSSSRTSLDPAARPPPERVRVWHDRSGQFRVDAAFLGFHSGKLRLHKTNGVIVEVPAEKMSVEDMKYVEKAMSRKSSRVAEAAKPRVSDDDVPLGVTAAAARRQSTAPPKKAPTIDWFDFFLSAGCDLDDCTRYAASFERDKMDDTILLDITDATMRSLGLREGDIIRVTKAIDKRRPQEKKNDQGEASSGPTKAPPNLFTSAGGALKNPSQRRGRPTPTKSLPATVDLQAISTVSDQIQRTSSPQVMTPTTVQPPPRTSSALVPAAANGFDDDAWTNRPSSTQPVATAVSTPPVAAPRPPSAPPATAAAPAPVPVAPPQPLLSPRSPPSRHPQPCPDERIRRLQSARPSRRAKSIPGADTAASRPHTSGGRHASRWLRLRPRHGFLAGGHGPASKQPTHRAPSLAVASAPAAAVQRPAGSIRARPGQPELAAAVDSHPNWVQQLYTHAPRRCDVAVCQSAHAAVFLSAQPTGFPGGQMQSQPTGFPGQQPMSFQPTGAPFGGFNGNSNGFVQSNPTGFAQSPFNNGQPSFNNGQQPFSNGQPSFNNNQSPFNNPPQFNGNGFSSPPPVPPLPSSATTNTTPANIFAQMKSGTFGAEDNAPQNPDRYDALRPNPMVAQATGWGGNGYQGGGYGGYN